MRPAPLLFAVLCVVSAALPSLGAWADGVPAAVEREVVVHDATARPLNELYVSPAGDDAWGDDRLGDRQVAPGEYARIRLGRTRDCLFDLLAVYDDASREERRGIDLCRSRAVGFDGSTLVRLPDPGAQRHLVTIANGGPRLIQQVFISPADSGDWGDDLLAASISVAGRANLTYRGACVADLRAVFDNRSAEERRGLDLCALGGITVAPGWTTADQPTVPGGAGGDPVALTVTNHAGHVARELYVSPDTPRQERGGDLLGGRLLADGAHIVVEVARPRGTCTFVAHVVFGGKLPDQDVAGVDLCRAATLNLPPRS